MDVNGNLIMDPARDDMLVLVDGNDCETGAATKLRVHVEGLMHRAFSVVLVRESEAGPELLVAQRSELKYHSAGLWANSCCSHPRVGEELMDAAYRRVREELGCEAEDLHEVCAFAYRAEFENGLCEYEYDHVLLGHCRGELSLDPAEVSDACWVGFDELASELAEAPEWFAAWAPIVLTMAMTHVRQSAGA